MDTRKTSMRTRSHSLINGVSNPSNVQPANGGTGTRTRHKSGNASYADLITRAILSSDDKRLTLSEIYDWMVDNVPGLKDQRYLHSAKGWKNAVRHTLSINPRFRKLARLGRPGWWTVDPDFLNRSAAAAIGVLPPSARTSSFTTTAATLIWDAQSNLQQQQQSNDNGFRGRLSSAPALFLSPIFATSVAAHQSNIGFSSPTPVATSNCSRPPSAMSILSSGASCTPIASPTSEPGAGSMLSPPQIIHSPMESSTQTVHVLQEQGGVGVLAVPRPLPVRMASVNETGTQTEEAFAHDPRNPVVAIQQRYRNMCDYFENVSPVSSPLTLHLGSHAGFERQHHVTGPEQEQTLNDTQRFDQSKWVGGHPQVRVSLGQCADGRPILIVTNTTMADHSIGHTQPASIPTPTLITNHSDTYHITDLSNHKPISLITSTTLEQLPEDLEGIDVDPSVGCDVVAVMNYEQNLGHCGMAIPKLEPSS